MDAIVEGDRAFTVKGELVQVQGLKLRELPAEDEGDVGVGVFYSVRPSCRRWAGVYKKATTSPLIMARSSEGMR